MLKKENVVYESLQGLEGTKLSRHDQLPGSSKLFQSLRKVGLVVARLLSLSSSGCILKFLKSGCSPT